MRAEALDTITTVIELVGLAMLLSGLVLAGEALGGRVGAAAGLGVGSVVCAVVSVWIQWAHRGGDAR